MLIRYDKEIINNLKKNIECTLPEEIIVILNNLSLKVGDPSYIKTPYFEKSDKPDLPNHQKKLPNHSLINTNTFNYCLSSVDTFFRLVKRFVLQVLGRLWRGIL